MTEQIFDLLGDPIPEGHGKRGRPPHMPTDEKRKLIMMLQAFDWTQERIASALNITPPTLRRVYFREVKFREEARARVEASLLNSLMAQVKVGNVSAIDKFFKRLDRHDLSVLEGKLSATKPAKQKQGKKEQQKEAAGNVANMYAPPIAPSLLN